MSLTAEIHLIATPIDGGVKRMERVLDGHSSRSNLPTEALFMVLASETDSSRLDSAYLLVLAAWLWMTISYSDGLVQGIWLELSDALHWVWAAGD